MIIVGFITIIFIIIQPPVQQHTYWKVTIGYNSNIPSTDENSNENFADIKIVIGVCGCLCTAIDSADGAKN
jgi:hypothetical protein